jgi:hypothetical protein
MDVGRLSFILVMFKEVVEDETKVTCVKYIDSSREK